MAAKHPLQEPLNNLVGYAADAVNLLELIETGNRNRAATRRASGQSSGAGSPTVHHKPLNRATVVAAVASWEAFCEELAITCLPHHPSAAVGKKWYPIAGTKGAVQTPNSANVAKLLWLYFQYDPRKDWNLLVRISAAESQGKSGWRDGSKGYAGYDAARALDGIVEVRHIFAHHDTKKKVTPIQGVIGFSNKGKPLVHSHHARNAVSAVLQLSVLTTAGLGRHLGLGDSLRWTTAMTKGGWTDLLSGTPAGRCARGWVGAPARHL